MNLLHESTSHYVRWHEENIGTADFDSLPTLTRRTTNRNRFLAQVGCIGGLMQSFPFSPHLVLSVQ